MLSEIRFLGVAFAAVGTDVRLEMFGFSMFGYVLEEGVFVDEAFVAGVALEGLVLLMAAAVGLKVAQLTEGFAAAAELAPVGLVTSVSSDVLLQV